MTQKKKALPVRLWRVPFRHGGRDELIEVRATAIQEAIVRACHEVMVELGQPLPQHFEVLDDIRIIG